MTEAGHIEVGGCDRSRSRASSARRPTSCAPTTCARARAPSATRSRACTDDFEVVFAAEGLPVHGGAAVLREEGLGCDVASAGELALALARGLRPGERIHLHGNAKSVAELEAARAAGVRAHRGRQPRRDRPARGRRVGGRARPAAGVAARQPGRAPRHAPTISTGQAEHEVRLRRRRDRRGDRARCARRRCSTSKACTCTSGRRSSSSSRSARRSRRSPGSAIFSEVNLGGGLGVAVHRAPTRPPSIEDYVAHEGRRGARRVRRRRADRRRARPRARRQLDA